jgi:hypothetical protein
MKNVDVFYTECMLKVNATSIKFVAIIDFAHDIDYNHPKNRTQLLDNRMEVFMMKKQEGITWENLELQGMTKQQLMEKRNKSISIYYTKKEQDHKDAQEKVHKMEKEVIEDQMKVDKHVRKHIKNAK